jgi:uncharacterized protein (TIGR00299 family) protein
MSKHLLVDASEGAAGDMFIAALVDLGASLSIAQAAVDDVYPGLVRFSANSVLRYGVEATHIQVVNQVSDQPSRNWNDIEEKILSSKLRKEIKNIAHQIFDRLAQAEAQVHNVPTYEVHFHEVGAADSIADIIGTAALLHELQISKIIVGDIEVGSGKIESEHGILDIPAPATAKLLSGLKLTSRRSGECTTPTAAAIFNAIGVQRKQAQIPKKIGRGAGTRDPIDYPNTLGVGIIDNVDEVMQVVIESNIDDIDPRLIPVVIEKLMMAGARDAWVEPIMMKKNRPGFTIKVLCLTTDQKKLGDVIFHETTSIGYRIYEVDKVVLNRFFTRVLVQGREIQVKVSTLDDKIIQVSPEFEDVHSLANSKGIPTRVIMEEARMAARNQGLIYGAEFSG